MDYIKQLQHYIEDIQFFVINMTFISLNEVKKDIFYAWRNYE